MKKFSYAKEDFRASSLPVTRKQLFFDIYKNNMKTVTKCGAALMLFALPIIIFMIFMYLGYMGISEEHYGDNLATMQLVWSIVTNSGCLLLMIPLLIGVLGVIRVLRQLIYQEGVDFWHEFSTGIRTNFRSVLWVSLINMAMYALSYAVMEIFAGIILSFGAMLMYVLVFVPMFFWYLLLANNYDAGFGMLYKNSAFFFAKTLGWSLLLTLALIWPVLTNLIPFTVSPLYISIRYSLMLILLAFYYPAVIIVFMLYSFAKFDQYINKENYPDFYRKGLYDLNNKNH